MIGPEESHHLLFMIFVYNQIFLHGIIALLLRFAFPVIAEHF